MSFQSYEPPVEEDEIVEDVEPLFEDEVDEDGYAAGDPDGERLGDEPYFGADEDALFVAMTTCRACGGGVGHRPGCPDTADLGDEESGEGYGFDDMAEAA